MSLFSLKKVLLENSYPFKLDNGVLSGEGANLLQKAVQESQFFLVGEEHGVAEIPLAVGALFQTAAESGYQHLAIEVGPLMAKALTEMLAQNGLHELEAFLQTDPLAIPFYKWHEDAQLLNIAYSIDQSNPGVLWGLDQEYMFSACYFLEQLEELVHGQAVKDKVRQVVDQAQNLRSMGQPCLFIAQEEVFISLKTIIQPANEPAHRILNALETSYHIYKLFVPALQGKVEAEYYNNSIREKLIKKNFVYYYEQVLQKKKNQPRVMFRMGYNHLCRGYSQTRVSSLGNLLSELAIINGRNSFNVFMMGGVGTQVQSGMEGTQPAEEAERLGLASVMKETDQALCTLFDLRPLRPFLYAHQIKDITPELAGVIWQYDSLIILSNSTAASSSWNVSN